MSNNVESLEYEVLQIGIKFLFIYFLIINGTKSNSVTGIKNSTTSQRFTDWYYSTSLLTKY